MRFSEAVEEFMLETSIDTSEATQRYYEERLRYFQRDTCVEHLEGRASLKAAIFDYIDVFYNRQRRHSALDYLARLDCETRARSLAAPSAAKLLSVHQTG